MLVAVEDLRAYVGAISSEDDLLIAFEESARGLLEDATGGRYFGEPVSRVDVLDGSGLPRLWLREEPTAVSVFSLECRAGDDWAPVETDTYERSGRAVRLLSGVWTACPACYRATYEAGFTPDTAPAGLRMLVRQLVSSMYQESISGGVVKEGDGDFSLTYASSGTQDVLSSSMAAAVLDRYRIHSL